MGYFHANERFDDYELNNVAKNIGDHICRYFPQAAILLVCVVTLLQLHAFYGVMLCYICNVAFPVSFLVGQ